MHLYPERAYLEGAELEIFKLLSYGATPGQWAEWLRAPLEHAAARGNFDLVDRLLKAGANGGAGWRGCRGRTLLDAAALGGNPDVLSALLRAGCRPDVRVVSVSSGRSALHLSIVCGHTAVAKKLILAGANVKHVDPADKSGPLHVATAGGHADVVSDLLLRGASTRAFDTSERSPLHVAAEMGHAKVVSVLLDNAADVEARGMDGKSPLMLASEQGHLSTARLLLAASARVTSCDIDGLTPLSFAAKNGHRDMINAILEHGAYVDNQDVYGWTALYFASRFDKGAAVDALLDAGARIDIEIAGEFTTNFTPLFMAAENNSVEALRVLLRRGADVTKMDRRSKTVLHRVCHRQQPGLEVNVELLLRFGASETAADDFGRTPADMLDVPAMHSCPAAERERVRALLARAPLDRAWRRRCWLVMLRARAERDRLAHLSDIDNASSQAREGEGSRSNKASRRDVGGGASAGGVGGGRRAGDEGSRAGDDGSGAGDDGSRAATRREFGDLVTVLMDLKSEEVFRQIVGYL